MSEHSDTKPGPETAAEETPEGAAPGGAPGDGSGEGGEEDVRRVGLSWRGYAVLGLVVIVAAAGAVLGYAPTRGWVFARLGLGPGEAAAQMAERISVLEGRVARLSTELGALGQAVQAGPSAARLDALARKVDALPAGADAARLKALETRLDALARRVETLGAEKAPKAAAAAPGDVALLGLALAIERGRPFAQLLAAARKGGAADEKLGAALDALAPWAEAGIPARAAIARDIAGIGAAAPAAAKQTPERPAPAAGFWDRVAASLRGLVTVRRVGPAPAPGPTAAAAKALAAGDEAAAAKALGGIDGARLSAESAAALGRAQKGLAARAAARDAVDAILARLAMAAVP